MAIVNSQAARRLWPGKVAVGKRLLLDESGSRQEWVTIIGVARDAKVISPVLQPAPAILYRPAAQVAHSTFDILLVRIVGQPDSTLAALQARLAQTVPGIDADGILISSLGQDVSNSLTVPRSGASAMSLAALLGVLLAAMGIYGVVAYTTALREQELALRIALGAETRRIFALASRRAFMLAAVGAGAGLTGSLSLSHLWRSAFYGPAAAADPAVYAVSTVVLVLAVFLASYVPARRAMRLDPMVALREI